MKHSAQTQSSPSHGWLKDIAGIGVFIAAVIFGTVLINTFVFRSFNVEGPSMESTLFTGDRLIVNRIPVTVSQVQGQLFIPRRGQVIVFKNPHYNGTSDEFIVKRVIAFSGERVLLKNGQYTVFNGESPRGFNPDDANNSEPGKPTAGEVDQIVPKGELFVSGDHRQLDPSGNPYSLDSRNGLGTVPLYEIIGPASIRIFPFTNVRSF
ncbi:MAG: signal peptidase I [Pedobacter sp.]|nr:MAG: signal peptidase I [Pedobacter sp.]